MSKNWLSVFWGILLVLAGGLFLATNLGYVREFSNAGWMWVMTAVSILCFATYLLTGLQRWGYLFPACIFGGTAVTIALGEAGLSSSAVGAPVLIGAGLPFLVAFGLDTRRHWWALIPAFIFGMLTLLLFIADRASGEWIGSAVLYSFALPFIVAFLTNTKDRKWALIPAYVFLVIGTVPWISSLARGEVIGAFVMFAVALPFAIAYLLNRKRTWGLIVAFILGVVGCLPLLTMLDVRGELIGTVVMFAVALPFWFAFLTASHRWWAVIPAGILTSLGVTVYLAGNWEFSDFGITALNSAMNLGLSATFFLVWLRRGSEAVDWAKIPAIAFLAFALMSLLLSTSLSLYWPVLLVVVGIIVLFNSLRPKAV